MARFRFNPRILGTILLLSTGACTGSLSCSGCGGGPLNPIPGGFNESARIERAAQVRVTQRGLDLMESEFQNLIGAFVQMKCNQPATDVPCPTGFTTLPAGSANPSTCDVVQNTCVETASGNPGPLIGFEIEESVASGATVCRQPTTGLPRRCYAWLRMEGLQLAPQPPNHLEATITAQLETTDIPFRYDSLGMDCVVVLSSNASGARTQDILIDASLNRWTAPAGTGGGQLQLDIDGVDATIADTDVDITRDPDPRSGSDVLDNVLCGIANLGPVKNALIPRLTGTLGDLVSDEVDKALGWRCGRPGDLACPSMTSCNTDGFCEEAGGRLVPVKLGFEGRLDFAAFLAGITGGRPGEGDMAFTIGGNSSTDSGGVTVSALGGAEVVTPDPSCAIILPSPRTRPGWVAPPALPNTDRADLDFDGTAETPYMLAAGVSEAFLDQMLWTVYTTGLMCGNASSYDIDLLNTGSLGYVLSSLNQLTHADRYPRNIYPVRLSIFPHAEPQITIGSGETMGTTLVQPLLELFLDDLEINFYAQIEERYVRLMTVTVDFRLGFGMSVTPANQLELILGDLPMSLTQVRVTNNEILAENTMDLEDALPDLLEFALPAITGALGSFALPPASELAGFEVTVLGIRGVEGATAGTYPNLAIYADLGFDASQVPNLSLAAETHAHVAQLHMPALDAWSISAPGGAQRPVVEIALDSQAPSGRALEHQFRIDGGLWSLFSPEPTLLIDRAELAIAGRHAIEVRARIAGQYKTLDPTPEHLELLIDPEGPRLVADLDRRAGGVFIDAYDVVSQDRLSYALSVDGQWRDVIPAADGFVAIPELASGDVGLVASATDEQGNASTVRVLAERAVAVADAVPAVIEAEDGCVCVRAPRSHASGPRVLAVPILAWALWVRRRRR